MRDQAYFSQTRRQQPYSSISQRSLKTASQMGRGSPSRPQLSNIMSSTQDTFFVKAGTIPQMYRTQNIDKLVTAPKHKPDRRKFNKNSTECLKEKENNALTMEDNFKLFDMPWISSLRFVEPKNTGTTKEASRAPDHPPNFYSDDMDKWSKKFAPSLQARKEFKNFYTQTHLINMTSKNPNTAQTHFSLPQRRNSRQSSETFTNIDFNYIGNTSNVNHLIQRRQGGVVPTPSQLNFELNLRNYRSTTRFTGEKPWMYPTNKVFSAVTLDKATFAPVGPVFTPSLMKKKRSTEDGAGDDREDKGLSTKKKSKQQPFFDKFRGNNINSVRHLLGKQTLIQNMQFSSSLRSYHPDRIKTAVSDSHREEKSLKI